MAKSRRESHLAKLAGQLNTWDKKLDELKVKATASAGTVKTDYEKKMDEIRAKRKEVEEYLQKMKTASEDSWKELKKGAEKALNSMTKAIKNAKAKFKR
jgi:ElaB/YqjD/DUF883 family membrane-anchored ribosome-binding protein